jgi:hypothetical protein
MERFRPFSLYDFLGYFAPGALFIYILIYFISIFDGQLIDQIFKVNFGKLQLFTVFVVISYVLGFILNYLSSITVEKYSVWMYGYPAVFLLFGTNKSYRKFQPLDNKKDILIDNYKSTEEFNFFINEINLRKPLKKKSVKRTSDNWRIALAISIWPISLLDLVIGRMCNLKYFYTNQLDENLSKSILHKISILFKQHDIDLVLGTDFFRIISHYYYEYYNNHLNNHQNYVALYGFSRSLSFVLAITAWLYIFSMFFLFFSPNPNCVFPPNFWILICLIFFAYIMFMCFMKFYRRFALESFMCLLVDKNLNNSNF